jgi:hypothetical protein
LSLWIDYQEEARLSGGGQIIRRRPDYQEEARLSGGGQIIRRTG